MADEQWNVADVIEVGVGEHDSVDRPDRAALTDNPLVPFGGVDRVMPTRGATVSPRAAASGDNPPPDTRAPRGGRAAGTKAGKGAAKTARTSGSTTPKRGKASTATSKKHTGGKPKQPKGRT